MSIRVTRRAFVAAAGTAAVPVVLPGLVPAAQAAAPMMGTLRPSYYRFKLGEFEVVTLLDGFIQMDGPHPIFGMNQPAEAVQAYAQANFLPPTKIENQFTPVLVNTGSALVLFDTGNGPARRPGAGNLVGVLRAVGYEPSQVDVVVLTHFHGDHNGGLMENGAPVYPNARYVTGQVEYDFWTAPDRLSGPTEAGARLVQSNVVPLAPKMSFVADGGDVVPGIRALQAFGHTPGHMIYHLESGGRRMLLWVDTSNHFIMSVQRPEWHVRSDMDRDMAVATRRRVLDMAATDRIPVSGYHMPFPAVGFVERTSDGYRWVPASYQMNL